MITVEMNYGEEEYRVLADLAVNTQKEKKSGKVWKVLLIIFGVYELVYGIYTLVTGPGALTGFSFVTAAAAFFLVFGGEKFLIHSAVLRRTKKLNQKANSTGGNHRKLTFDENQCTITSEAGSGEYGWDAFTAWGELSHYLWIRRNDNRFVLVDMNKLTERYGNLLREYCKEKISKRQWGRVLLS